MDSDDDRSPPTPEEEEGEDLFGPQMARDYEVRPELDRFDPSQLDDERYEHMSIDERRRIDEMLDRRDNTDATARAMERTTGRRMPAALLEEKEEPTPEMPEIPSPEEGESIPSDTPREQQKAFLQDLDGEDEDDEFHNEVRGPLREWVLTEGPRRAIAKKFYRMLRDFTGPTGSHVYVERVTTACSENKQSFEVSYPHLTSRQHDRLAIWLADAPSEMLSIFNDVAYRFALALFPKYGSIHSRMFVRIADVPVIDPLRSIRQLHLNCLIRTSGVVTRRTGVFPQLQIISFDCTRCGHLLGPYTSLSPHRELKVSVCPACNAKGPFRINQEQTVYRNFQRITLQESPGSVPAGRLPRSKDVLLLHDLIDVCRPGEEIDTIGIYRHTLDSVTDTEAGFPVFTTVIEANNIMRHDAPTSSGLSEIDERDIKELSKDPRIFDRIVASLAPSIYGHDDVKRALVLALFGGCRKEVANSGHRLRGDINALIVGDPGTAKSQLLKYCASVANRSVFTTGQGASAVGLTASVQRDPITKEWTLEGGALVLADNGVCLIDEFDKMNDRDRTSLHEAMEQQSISISKAGIVTTLQARCAILAAANPIRGRYDASKTFAQNVDLTDPILSRFDILCIVRDTADLEEDKRLAKFVVNSHIRSHPSNIGQEMNTGPQRSPEGLEIIPPELLKKYIQYSRSRIRPSLTQLNSAKIVEYYKKLRHRSTPAGSMLVAVRHLESIIRIAESSAKMHLRQYVWSDDVDLALKVMTESFCASQKFSIRQTLENEFREYLTYSVDDTNRLLMNILNGLFNSILAFNTARGHSGSIRIARGDFVEKAAVSSKNVDAFFKSPLFQHSSYKLDRDNIVRDDHVSRF